MGMFSSSNSGYLKCQKCNSVDVEIVNIGAKTKLNVSGMIFGRNSFLGTTPSLTKTVVEKKCHCRKCGYIW